MEKTVDDQLSVQPAQKPPKTPASNILQTPATPAGHRQDVASTTNIHVSKLNLEEVQEM